MVAVSLENIVNTYSIYCMMGNSSFFQRIEIDQMQDTCYTDRENYPKENGTFIKETEYGLIYENSLCLRGNFTIEHFPMLASNFVFEKQADLKRWGIGLSFKFKNESQSITHQLKSMGLIRNLSYSFAINKDNSSTLYFGGIPDSATHNKTKTQCKINPSNATNWSCQLSKVSIGKAQYMNNYDASFQASESYIRAPLDFMKFLVNTPLKNSIKANKCDYDKIHYNVYCPREVIDRLNIISFTIGEYRYDFNASLLFEHNSDPRFRIRRNYLSESWVIGTAFLDHFSLLFDYDNEMVSFYLNNDNKDVSVFLEDYGRHNVVVILIICIIMLNIGLISLSYLKYWNSIIIYDITQ